MIPSRELDNFLTTIKQPDYPKHGRMLVETDYKTCTKHGTVFDDMKCSRARFKYELRCLKRHKNQQIGDNHGLDLNMNYGV